MSMSLGGGGSNVFDTTINWAYDKGVVTVVAVADKRTHHSIKRREPYSNK